MKVYIWGSSRMSDVCEYGNGLNVFIKEESSVNIEIAVQRIRFVRKYSK